MSYNDSDRNCWSYNKEDKREDKCCCKKSMKEALALLADDSLKQHIDWKAFAFIGEKYLVGTNLEKYPLDLSADERDNINIPSAQYKGLDYCNCDLINIAASAIYYPFPAVSNADKDEVELKGFGPINYASLCDMQAIVFNYTCDRETFETNLTKLLDKPYEKCDIKCNECCCNDGIFNKIFNPMSPVNTVSLTAGWLAVKELTVLGRIKNVLVLSHPYGAIKNKKRIYFICLDSIGFIG